MQNDRLTAYTSCRMMVPREGYSSKFLLNGIGYQLDNIRDFVISFEAWTGEQEQPLFLSLIQDDLRGAGLERVELCEKSNTAPAFLDVGIKNVGHHCWAIVGITCNRDDLHLRFEKGPVLVGSFCGPSLRNGLALTSPIKTQEGRILTGTLCTRRGLPPVEASASILLHCLLLEAR